jgi:hypothetical protein
VRRIGERGASLHILNAERSEEYVRFDNFQHGPHYHYILNDLQHNVVWGYDPDSNGPMLPWALAAIRDRLPSLLRRAGAVATAERVEREGFDLAVLPKLEQAMTEAWERTVTEADAMVAEGRDWYVRWKEIHPQFNTVD